MAEDEKPEFLPRLPPHSITALTKSVCGNVRPMVCTPFDRTLGW